VKKKEGLGHAMGGPAAGDGSGSRHASPRSRVNPVNSWEKFRGAAFGDASADLPGSPPGVVLGRQHSDLYRIDPLRPVLVIGPQRSRKTTSIAIPTLLEWPGPAVVTSIRADLLAGTYQKRSEQGEAVAYEPMKTILDPDRRINWNPLQDCRTWDGAISTSRALTESGTLNLREGEFWFGLAASALAPMLFAAAANGYIMSDVVRWVKTQEEFEIRSLLTATGEERPLESFEAVTQMEARLQSSVYGTCMSVLRAFDYDSVCESSVDGFSVDGFFNGAANTLYLCAPPDYQKELAPLFVTLVKRILKEAYARDARGEMMAPLLVLLDEAANIAPLASLGTLASTAAGCGIQLVSVFHDLSQMVDLYGEPGAMSIANNHSALLVLPGSRDTRTIDLVRSMVGDDSIEGGSETCGNNANASFIRRLPHGHGLCIYENNPPTMLTLRSSTHDADLLEVARGESGVSRLTGFRGGTARS